MVGYKHANSDPKKWTRRDVRRAKERYDRQQKINPDRQLTKDELPKETRSRLKQYKAERLGTEA